jgi:hypothetical protein
MYYQLIEILDKIMFSETSETQYEIEKLRTNCYLFKSTYFENKNRSRAVRAGAVKAEVLLIQFCNMRH